MTADARTVMMRAVPNEIQDRILDFLHDSKPTLKACALVCRAWVFTSRYHLFSSIGLDGKNVDALEELCKNPNCTIQSCVHLIACTYSSSTKIGNLLHHLAPSSLHLDYWSSFIQHTLATLAPFPSIERLHVASGYSIDTVLDLFVAFPNLRELCMIDCSKPLQPHRDRGYVLRPHQLRSLRFSGCDLDPLLRHFVGGRIVPTNLLSIEDLENDHISVVGEYFLMSGNMLQELRIGFLGDEDEVLGTSHFILCSVLTSFLSPSARFCDGARLECLTGLQCLTIDTRCYGFRFSTYHVKFLASILEKIPSTLRRLHFEIPTPPPSPRIGEWHRIGEVLQRRRFLQLTELVFIPRATRSEHIEEWIREDFSVFEERGILSVRCFGYTS